jgi:hypothetical protein
MRSKPPKSTKALPCPWCGGEAHPLRHYVDDLVGYLYSVDCIHQRCGARGPERLSPEGAVGEWNEVAKLVVRAADPAQAPK